MNIKKAYNYFYYKIYKSIEYTSGQSDGRTIANFKTGLVIIFLEIIFFAALFIYYNIYISKDSSIVGTELQWITMVILLVLIDYFIFYNSSIKWKEIFIKFDQLPKKKNNLGSWIVFLTVISLIGNLIFSFYCLDRKAKKDQVGPYAPEIVAKKRRGDSLRKAQQVEKLKYIYGEENKK
ncbi:hypothetical protein [Chryseobacterium vrystaatense]|uniref:Uncharacterized protein n=1 Tax=Chryseobacterium vrystaatense TaxID=307480 RepID=A0A1M5DX48_9FLAO|nr:hypothetical protein [Chryseobacterium vrystaatense]SHF71598.1 hypothetical protein SAMN02787073_2745 [Chryseobacterium vrystaatense]